MPAMTRDELEQTMIRRRPTWAEEMAMQNRTPLQVAADGLTPEQVAYALSMVGCDPTGGLEGVPASRETMALAALRIMLRRQ
jgi:hypothetical protein